MRQSFVICLAGRERIHGAEPPTNWKSMLEFLKKLLGKERREPVAEPKSVLRRTGAIAPAKKPAPASRVQPGRARPRVPAPAPRPAGDIDSIGPGKNVLTSKKYHREDSGTHETLKIIDHALLDTGEEKGIDPYNTGSFDRSRNWDKRFRD
jgi:hypothetical protein